MTKQQKLKQLYERKALLEKIINSEMENTTNNSNKDVILQLIITDLDNAFVELDKIFGKTNALYNDLCNEYISRAESFSLQKYRSKLKLFVSRNI